MTIWPPSGSGPPVDDEDDDDDALPEDEEEEVTPEEDVTPEDEDVPPEVPDDEPPPDEVDVPDAPPSPSGDGIVPSLPPPPHATPSPIVASETTMNQASFRAMSSPSKQPTYFAGSQTARWCKSFKRIREVCSLHWDSQRATTTFASWSARRPGPSGRSTRSPSPRLCRADAAPRASRACRRRRRRCLLVD